MIDEVPRDGVAHEPDEPPVEPPAGCADPTLWRVAHALYRAHRPRTDNFCECKAFWPCPDAQLAEESLQLAYDRPLPRSRLGSGSRSSNLGRWSSA